MNKFITNLQVFHDKYFPDRPRPVKFGHVPEDVVKLRLNFLFEELCELAEAHGFYASINQFNKKGTYGVSFIKGRAPDVPVDQEGSLDAIVDLLYVAFGTAELFGAFKPQQCSSCSGVVGCNRDMCQRTILEEAWDRVQEANMKKVRVKTAGDSKRGSKWDVKKPDGWKPPSLTDLVK